MTSSLTVTERLRRPLPVGGWRGWVGPAVVTVLGAILRLVNLGQPHAVVFDETYYAKDGLSLLLFGFERKSVENANELILASNGDPQSLLNIFTSEPSFVVHPPLGKWIIASGIEVFGMTPFGWRIAVAIVGILSVLLVARIVRRLTRSNLLGTLAGLFMAIDGMGIVMSRTALLDVSLMFFVVIAFGCLLLDRDRTRAKLANLVEDPNATWGKWGPKLGFRPWLVAAGIALGLACGVKWSGLYFVAAFGLLTVFWDISARRLIGVNNPWVATGLRDVLPAFLSIVGIGVVVYLLTWWGWFASDDAYLRNWAAEQPGGGIVPDSLRSLWYYHSQALGFHTKLTSPHSYSANPWLWPVQGRPTSFSVINDGDVCGASQCRAHVLALGNPILWWAATLAMIHQAWRWIARRDWRAGAVLCGFLASWLPWLFFQQRTVFEFYSIVMLPFMIMALVLTIGTVLGDKEASANRRKWGVVAVGSFTLIVIVVSAFFYPIWVGDPLTIPQWDLRMWMPNWI